MVSEYDKGCPCEDGKVPDQNGKCVMPEVTFMAFIMSLNTSALYHLGEIADPKTGEKLLDLPLARHAIDTLALLEKKTAGNLDDDETEMLKNILFDVKLRFVAAAKDEKAKAVNDGSCTFPDSEDAGKGKSQSADCGQTAGWLS